VPIEQVDESMIEAGDKNCDFRTVAVQHQVILIPYALATGRKCGSKSAGCKSNPSRSHSSQKELASAVDMVVGMQHTAIVRYEELCDGSNDSFAGELHGTAGEQDGGVPHLSEPVSRRRETRVSFEPCLNPMGWCAPGIF